jgi:hypothetical protein
MAVAATLSHKLLAWDNPMDISRKMKTVIVFLVGQDGLPCVRQSATTLAHLLLLTIYDHVHVSSSKIGLDGVAFSMLGFSLLFLMHKNIISTLLHGYFRGIAFLKGCKDYYRQGFTVDLVLVWPVDRRIFTLLLILKKSNLIGFIIASIPMRPRFNGFS